MLALCHNEGGASIVRADHLVASLGEDMLEQASDHRLVVRYQNLRHWLNAPSLKGCADQAAHAIYPA